MKQKRKYPWDEEMDAMRETVKRVTSEAKTYSVLNRELERENAALRKALATPPGNTEQSPIDGELA